MYAQVFRSFNSGWFSIIVNQGKLFPCNLSRTRQKQRSITDSRKKLDIHLILEEEKPKVLTFLKANFFNDEPINQSIKLMSNSKSVQALSTYSMKYVHQNYSLLIRTQAGEIAGVCLNSVRLKEGVKGEEETDPIFGKIARLLGYVDKQAKVFEKFPDIDKVLAVDILTIGKNFQRHGLGKVMIDSTREIARKNCIKMLRVDCTSHFSARASEKLGMQCIYELKYEDYKENGEQVFKPDPPHTALKVFVERLDK